MAISKSTLGFLAGVATAALLGVIAHDHWPAFSAPATGAMPPPQKAFVMPVPVVAVARKTIPIYRDYVGATEAIRTVTLQAKVSGYLAARGAPDGADVGPGELLYRIDPRDFQAALDQVKAQAQRDAAALDYARANQQRNASLSKSGWATKDSYDQVTSALHQSEASLAADQAAIRTAQLNLGYSEIRAPFAGRIGRSLVHEGAMISAAGTSLNTLVQLDPIYATFNPSESELAEIEAYRARGPVVAELLPTGQDQPPFRGTLTFLDNAVDRATGTIVARATIVNPDRRLLPGQFVRIRLRLGDQPDALLVPQVAVGSSQLGKFVYVVGAGGKVEQRLVTTGATDGELVVVAKGLAEGDSVIVGNLQKIGAGAQVQPMPAAKTGS
jgi:multidrug efflux system membrane fusion protein